MSSLLQTSVIKHRKIEDEAFDSDARLQFIPRNPKELQVICFQVLNCDGDRGYHPWIPLDSH